MTPDQIARLQATVEDLAEIFLDEADSSAWPGAGLSIGEMSSKERGDRVWCKKNAVSTLALLNGAIVLLRDDKPVTGVEEEDLDERIRTAEKRASAMVEALMKKTTQRAA